MTMFKRIEIWLLLFLVGGAIWFVFKTDGDAEKPEPAPVVKSDSNGKNSPDDPEAKGGNTKPDTGPKKSARFEIRKVSAVQEPGGKVVELTVLGRNQDGDSLELKSPTVRLVTDAGDEIDSFFLPFEPPPVLEADGESTAELKYWIQGEGNAAKLWLEIDGERLAVNLDEQS
ncbi:MAG: hypothetical protein HKN23_17580 [Verrucomicrobiales bacterium]|nr:hypothetical protein [Verrucomicrobiales bacterium]